MKFCPSLKYGMVATAIFAMAIIGMNTATAQSLPFTGVVVKNEVSVRAGAGPRYYIVGHLKKGDQVTVKEIIFGWNKIVPPQGEYSYIPSKFVDANKQGTEGKVNADNTTVTAGNLKGPGESYRQQVTLNKGEQVTILGKEGDYYKIAPPQKAVVFLAPGTIRRAESLKQQNPNSSKTSPSADTSKSPGADDNQKKSDTKPDSQKTADNKNNSPDSAQGKQSETAKNSKSQSDQAQTAKGKQKPAATTTASAESKKTTAATSTTSQSDTTATGKPSGQSETKKESSAKPQVKTPAKSSALRKVEQQMLPYFKEPVSKQPLSKMKAAYANLAKDTSLPKWDHKIIDMRLKMIARNQKLAKTLAQIKALQQKINSQENKQIATKKPAPAQHYDIVGYLSASTIYDGKNLPKLYRLADAKGYTLTYVSPKKINTHQMLGRLVGVTGKEYHNATLDLNIFKIKNIFILSKESNQ